MQTPIGWYKASFLGAGSDVSKTADRTTEIAMCIEKTIKRAGTPRGPVIGLLTALACASVAFSAPALAQDYRADTPARIEAIPIQTLTVSTEQFLTGDHYASPTTIAGSLLVAPGEGPRPLVVFVAGGSGFVGGSFTSWADQFLEMGISVLLPRCLCGRGAWSPMATRTLNTKYSIYIRLWEFFPITPASIRTVLR